VACVYASIASWDRLAKIQCYTVSEDKRVTGDVSGCCRQFWWRHGCLCSWWWKLNRGGWPDQSGGSSGPRWWVAVHGVDVSLFSKRPHHPARRRGGIAGRACGWWALKSHTACMADTAAHQSRCRRSSGRRWHRSAGHSCKVVTAAAAVKSTLPHHQVSLLFLHTS